MSSATLEIPATPPSLNQIGYRSHWAVGRRHKMLWQEWISTALMVAAVPRGLGAVVATAEVRFPQRRRRDEGNFRVILEKALGDALVEGGWLPDDTAEHYRFDRLELSAPWPEAATDIHLTYGTPDLLLDHGRNR